MNEFELSSKLIEMLAKSNENLIILFRKLQENSGTQIVKRGMDCQFYGEKLILEEFVEANLYDGSSICYWLEIGKKELEWEIEASILLNKDSEQETIKLFPVKFAKTLDELDLALSDLTSAFLEETNS